MSSEQEGDLMIKMNIQNVTRTGNLVTIEPGSVACEATVLTVIRSKQTLAGVEEPQFYLNSIVAKFWKVARHLKEVDLFIK